MDWLHLNHFPPIYLGGTSALLGQRGQFQEILLFSLSNQKYSLRFEVRRLKARYLMVPVI